MEKFGDNAIDLSYGQMYEEVIAVDSIHSLRTVLIHLRLMIHQNAVVEVIRDGIIRIIMTEKSIELINQYAIDQRKQLAIVALKLLSSMIT